MQSHKEKIEQTKKLLHSLVCKSEFGFYPCKPSTEHGSELIKQLDCRYLLGMSDVLYLCSTYLVVVFVVQFKGVFSYVCETTYSLGCKINFRKYRNRVKQIKCGGLVLENTSHNTREETLHLINHKPLKFVYKYLEERCGMNLRLPSTHKHMCRVCH